MAIADVENRNMVRLLIAAPGTDEVFTDAQIDQFLTLEGGRLKLAAARALSVIATNEALVSKVIKDGDLSTDGAKLAAELRAQAKELRDSHAAELADTDDNAYFGITNLGAAARVPEFTERPTPPGYWG